MCKCRQKRCALKIDLVRALTLRSATFFAQEHTCEERHRVLVSDAFYTRQAGLSCTRAFSAGRSCGKTCALEIELVRALTLRGATLFAQRTYACVQGCGWDVHNGLGLRNQDARCIDHVSEMRSAAFGSLATLVSCLGGPGLSHLTKSRVIQRRCCSTPM